MMRTTGTYWTVRRRGFQIHISPQTLESDGTYCYRVHMDIDTNPVGKLGCNVFETKDQAVVVAYKKLLEYRRSLFQKAIAVGKQARELFSELPLEMQEVYIEEGKKKWQRIGK